MQELLELLKKGYIVNDKDPNDKDISEILLSVFKKAQNVEFYINTFDIIMLVSNDMLKITENGNNYRNVNLVLKDLFSKIEENCPLWYKPDDNRIMVMFEHTLPAIPYIDNQSSYYLTRPGVYITNSMGRYLKLTLDRPCSFQLRKIIERYYEKFSELISTKSIRFIYCGELVTRIYFYDENTNEENCITLDECILKNPLFKSMIVDKEYIPTGMFIDYILINKDEIFNYLNYKYMEDKFIVLNGNYKIRKEDLYRYFSQDDMIGLELYLEANKTL